VELFAGLYDMKVDKKTLKNLVELVSLGEKAKSRVKNLSGGQLQRLALITALVNEPEIIFLDEPTTGLDPQARRYVWQIIETLKKQGKTILLTTHYMEEAERLADRVLIMDHGKIIASGTVWQLVESLNMDSYIEFTVDDVEKIAELRKEIDGMEILEEQRATLATNDVEETIQVLLNRVKQMGFQIDNITIRRPNLEDVFLHLTGRYLRD
jgi:ABC-type multidrug transport system, ATPase component